jgi:hypothetical protein
MVSAQLVADSLAALMGKAASLGLIKGVMAHLLEEGITYIQYVDDTILIIEGDDLSITNMKFILYCFEWLSGLKINYYKSEAFVFGMTEMDSVRVANMLNCQLGCLPMKYLAITISDSKLVKGAFVSIPEKVSKNSTLER